MKKLLTISHKNTQEHNKEDKYNCTNIMLNKVEAWVNKYKNAK